MLSVVTDASTTTKARVNGKAAKEDADSLGVDVCILPSSLSHLYLLREPSTGNPPSKEEEQEQEQLYKRPNPTNHSSLQPPSPQACRRLSPLSHSLTYRPS